MSQDAVRKRIELKDPIKRIRPNFWARPRSCITIKHPAHYAERPNLPLLSLPCFDQEGGGCHFGTVVAACGIIANNTYDGYLTKEINGTAITLEFDEVLEAGDYWYHIPEVTGAGSTASTSEYYDYPVVARLEDWRFPHEYFLDNQPSQPRYCLDHWRPPRPLPDEAEGGDDPSALRTALPLLTIASIADAASVRNASAGVCPVTASIDGTDEAHLVETKNESWWAANNMDVYTIVADQAAGHGGPLSRSNPDHSKNKIMLRKDVHFAFDNGALSLIPKARCASRQRYSSYAVHAIKATHSLGCDYHNQLLAPMPEVPTAFFFARFAAQILPLAFNFVTAMGTRERRVVLADPNGPETYSVRSMKSSDIRARFVADAAAKSRRSSPTKRSRGSESRSAAGQDAASPLRGRQLWDDRGRIRDSPDGNCGSCRGVKRHLDDGDMESLMPKTYEDIWREMAAPGSVRRHIKRQRMDDDDVESLTPLKAYEEVVALQSAPITPGLTSGSFTTVQSGNSAIHDELDSPQSNGADVGIGTAADEIGKIEECMNVGQPESLP